MFSLSLPCQLIQGPAVRTWNCVAHFANLLWCKFNYVKNPTMPRSRRRHHSRSRTRSRSRSHSCDRDRDIKRRKIDNYDSPHKRSDSPQDEELAVNPIEQQKNETLRDHAIEGNKSEDPEILLVEDDDDNIDVHEQNAVGEAEKRGNLINTPANDKSKTGIKLTPTKPLTPKQLQKKLLSEEKKRERDRIKEEKLKMLEEKKRARQEEFEKKMLEKQKKIEQKQKDLEEKQKIKEIKEEKKKKEREEKEMKRKEKEEKDEQKRKEQIEKSIEKQKLVEKNEKISAAFVNFFTKKSDSQNEDNKSKETESSFAFMPFEIKSDMRLAPIVRAVLDESKKTELSKALDNQIDGSYLVELKSGKNIGKNEKTWPNSDTTEDVVILEDVNPGESIEEQTKVASKVRPKFFKFDGSRRPAYYGTWRKKSVVVKPRRPFALDNEHFDYDLDSDEEWEEDDSGESLRGSDDDKENDSENEYEEDNEFFVPHGHLSDDELDEEENISPEAHKAKLKLLKKAFEEEMRCKTEKIKPRVIGCIWYNREGNNVDSAIDSFLKPLSIISNGPVTIKKRSKFASLFNRRSFVRGKELDVEYIPAFLKFVHGSARGSKALVTDFLNSLEKQNLTVEVSKTSLSKKLRELASWTRSPEGGPPLKKYCWCVHKNFSEEYNVDLPRLN